MIAPLNMITMSNTLTSGSIDNMCDVFENIDTSIDNEQQSSITDADDTDQEPDEQLMLSDSDNSVSTCNLKGRTATQFQYFFFISARANCCYSNGNCTHIGTDH